MKTSKFREEQIAYVLREVEGGSPIAYVCREMGLSESTSTFGRRNTHTSA